MTFKDIINNAKIQEVNLPKNLREDSQNISAILLLNSNYDREYTDKFDIRIKSDENKYELDISNKKTKKFTYMQKANFEKYFFRTINKIIHNKSEKVENFSILEKEEKEYLCSLYDSSKKYFDENLTIVECFEKNVKKSPNEVCVIFEDQEYTYKYIDEKSNELALYLKEKGIKNQQSVMIYMDRSEKVIISILAILKCRCIYIPIDISTPIERIKVIYNDASPFCVIVDDVTDNLLKVENINKINILNVEENQDSYSNNLITEYFPNKEDYCYIIYTSGTTGKPKGVAIRNRNVANFISNNIIVENLSDKETATLVAVNKIGFDAFVGDILLPLGAGLKILMTSSEELNNPKKLIKSVKKYNGNIIQTTPTRINLSFLESDPKVLKDFQVIVSGGELLVDEIANQVLENTEGVFINIYGPTETTVWATCSIVSNGEYGIGKPVQNANCFIFNRYLKLVPTGEEGIIYISGAGLGSYCFDKEKNAQKYIECAEVGELVYDSGDIGYIDDNDVLIFCERIDTQVKINGVRIELEEIESVALEMENIKECVVTVQEIPEVGNALVLYYRSDGNMNCDNDIKKYLAKRLPATYIPRFFVKLDKMPVTLTHKIDRKKLPIPKEENCKSKIILPRNKVENDIYSAFLKCNNKIEIGVTTNLNGIYDSLDIIRVYCELLDIGYNIDIKTLTEAKNISEIASEYSSDKKTNNLEKNKYPQIFFEKYDDYNSYNNILLTGVTGFLGIHILQEILRNTKSNVICFLHNNKNLKELYKEYDMDVPYDEKRIKIVHGSLEDINFGLNESDLEIIDKADSIINSAAYVNYYGNKETFENSNIKSVRNLINFAIKKNIVLNHISTLSVLGNEKLKNEIKENDLYFGQDVYANQYIKSKFLAELEIKNATQEGLKYRVFRIGRLTWRIEDKKFQKNFESNEFYESLKLFIEMKMIPENLKNTDIEISPVNYCAKAIYNLIQQNKINGVFHVFNENVLKMQTIIDFLNNLGHNIRFTTSEEFMREFIKRDDEIKTRNMIHISNDQYEMESNPALSNELTNKLLVSSGFKWPIIDKEYFNIF